MTKEPKKIYCEWMDASAQASWHDPSKARLVLIRSVGWLAHEDKEKIVIAASIDEDGWSVASSVVPKKWIKKRKYIR